MDLSESYKMAILLSDLIQIKQCVKISHSINLLNTVRQTKLSQKEKVEKKFVYILM